MREVIVKEWRDDIGMIHREEAEELVRCGNCKHRRGEKPRIVGLIYCKEHRMVKREIDYCSYGEKLK